MGKQLHLDSFDSRPNAGKVTTRVVAASVLVLGSAAALPVAASAHGDDNNNGGLTATYTEGEGFPLQGQLDFQAEGRLGNSNSNSPLSGDWELGVGNNTQVAGEFSQAQYDFTTEEQRTTDFTVEYDDQSGEATLTAEDGTSTSFDVGEVDADAKLYIVAVNKAGSLQSTNLTNLTLDGQPLEAGVSGISRSEIILSGFGPEVGYIEVSGAGLQDGFTVSGTAYFTSTASDGSEQAFQVQVRDDGNQDDEQEEDNQDDNNQGGDENQDEGGTGDDITDETDAPLVKLTSPEQNATVNGTVDIRATVRDEDPDHYYLRIENAEGNKVFSEVYQEDEVITNELIHQFNTEEFEDGEYTIFLSARDGAGNKDGDINTEGESVDRVTVMVNNDGQGGNEGEEDNQDDNGQGDNNQGNQDENNNDNNGNDGVGNGDEDNGDVGQGDGQQPRNPFARLVIQIRGNVENLFLNIYNFFGFRF